MFIENLLNEVKVYLISSLCFVFLFFCSSSLADFFQILFCIHAVLIRFLFIYFLFLIIAVFDETLLIWLEFKLSHYNL